MHRALQRPLALAATIAGVLIPLPVTAGAQQPRAPAAAPDSAGCFTRDVSRAPAGSAARDPGATITRSGFEERGPAIVLFAEASAREVRFAAQPRISVRLCGALMDSVRVIERRNLPDPVQPGVTYRDVYIAVEILGHVRAECLADRIAGRSSADACAALQRGDSTMPPRRSPP